MKKIVENYEYSIDGQNYPIVITRKTMKNVTYRFRNDTFYISAPRFCALAFILKGLDKHGPGLIKRCVKPTKSNSEIVHIFGEPYPINNINIDGKILDYTDQRKFYVDTYYMLYDYVYERVKFFGAQMGINTDIYRVRVRNTRSRYGSNSVHTKTLAFSMQLVHFSPEIIDSVVVHELAHCFVYDHSKRFYNVVYQHCPNYNMLRKKLINSVFK